MFFRPSLFAIVLVCSTLLSGPTASAQTNSQRDAVIGGVAGSIIGGIVGNQNDETPEGKPGLPTAATTAGYPTSKSDFNSRRDLVVQQRRQPAVDH